MPNRGKFKIAQPCCIWQPFSHKKRYTLERLKMTGKAKRNILIFFIAIVLLGIITGYMIWNKPHRDVKEASAVKITMPLNCIKFLRLIRLMRRQNI